MPDQPVSADVEAVIRSVLVDLHDYFAEFNDDPDSPLGTYARVERDAEGGTLTVLHESEPWGFKLTLTPHFDGRPTDA